MRKSKQSEYKLSSPAVNIIHNFLCLLFVVRLTEVLLDPCHEVILEGAFDKLMEDIW